MPPKCAAHFDPDVEDPLLEFRSLTVREFNGVIISVIFLYIVAFFVLIWERCKWDKTKTTKGRERKFTIDLSSIPKGTLADLMAYAHFDDDFDSRSIIKVSHICGAVE